MHVEEQAPAFRRAMSAALVISGAVAALFLTIYYFFTYHFNYWKNKGVVGPEPVFPYGTIKDLTFRNKSVNVFYKDLYNDYPNEKVVGFYRYRNPVLFIRDVDLIKRIMIKDFDNFVERGVEFSEKGLGMNVFHANADAWKFLRNKFSPIFTSGKLKGMFHLLNERGDKYLDYMDKVLSKDRDVDSYPLLQDYTKSGISSCAFGLDLDLLGNKQLYNSLKKIDDTLLTPTYAFDVDWMFPGILRKLNMDLFPSVVSQFFYKLVKEITNERNGVPSNRKDFMDLILEMKNKSNGDDEKSHAKLNDHTIAAQAFVFYVGGFETSASTMSYMMHELAYHPEIQDRLVTEINDVIEKHGQLTYEAIQEMTYLTQVFDETVRKYSVVDPLIRVTKNDYRVPDSDLVIEKGTHLVVSISGIHYDQKYYPDPMKFDPERFSPENAKNRNSAAYLPFGIGPRNCIGMRFGQLSSRVCLAKLLPKYRVEPGSGSKYNITYDPMSVVLKATGGIPIKFLSRGY